MSGGGIREDSTVRDQVIRNSDPRLALQSDGRLPYVLKISVSTLPLSLPRRPVFAQVELPTAKLTDLRRSADGKVDRRDLGLILLVWRRWFLLFVNFAAAMVHFPLAGLAVAAYAAPGPAKG